MICPFPFPELFVSLSHMTSSTFLQQHTSLLIMAGMATIIGLVLEKSTTTHAKLHKATINNSTLHHVVLSNSKITNSNLRDCTLTNCIITNTKLSKCNIEGHNTNSCELSECQLLPNPNTLRTFPPEIREMIFNAAMVRHLHSWRLFVVMRSCTSKLCEFSARSITLSCL